MEDTVVGGGCVVMNAVFLRVSTRLKTDSLVPTPVNTQVPTMLNGLLL
jgi:hypothetical protein